MLEASQVPLLNQAREARDAAARARRLAAHHAQTSKNLLDYAREMEAKAKALEQEAVGEVRP